MNDNFRKLEIEAMTPRAHRRMARRLYEILKAEDGVEELFELREKYCGVAEQEEWLNAFEASGMMNRWIEAVGYKSAFKGLDDVCLLERKDAFARKIWGDNAFDGLIEPIPASRYPSLLISILVKVLYTVPVQWCMGSDRIGENRVRMIFAATAVEQRLSYLPSDQQPETDDEKFRLIAAEIGVAKWEQLQQDVILYKRLRGDRSSFVATSEDAAETSADPDRSPISESEANSRAHEASKNALRLCLGELMDQAPNLANAVLYKYDLIDKKNAERPKKLESLAAKARSVLQECIGSKAERIVV